jgi:nucleotide-binding universal stress UspA family protein
LVPLDGSRLAESVLPAAAWLARKTGARLMLVRVHGEPHLATEETAAKDLEAHAERLRARGIRVDVHVHERPVDDVATAIDGHAHELRADLIAMCAHGRTNLRTRLTGSIAERILRGGSVPILLRTAQRPDDREFRLRRLLAPIDFGHDVDSALATVRALALADGTTVVLLSALEGTSPPTTLLLPGTSAILRQLDRGELERRLEELAAGLRGDVASVETVVSDRRPVDAIATEVASLDPDLILLVTDAHSRLARWHDPSATQRLLAIPDRTLLLMREL